MSEASVAQNEATWEDLPEETRAEVAKFLDKQSRLSLRQCSKTDKNAVDQLPVSITFLKVSRDSGASKLSIEKCEERNEQVFVGRRTLGFDEALSYFSSIFKHKESTLEMLEVGQYGILGIQENQEQVEKFLERVLKEAEIRKEKYKIAWRINKLQWNFDIKSTHLLEFLSNFHTDYIDALTITGQVKAKEVIKKLAEVEQWKQLKTVYIKPSFDCNGILNYFSHMNELILSVEDLQKEELADFIKNYRSKNVRLHYFFHIHSKNKFDKNFLRDASKYFNSAIQNEQLEIETVNDKIYLKFKIPNDEGKCLAVGVCNNKVLGLVSNSEDIATDLAVLEYYIIYRINWLMHTSLIL